MSLTVTVELAWVICYRCGVPFAMTRGFYNSCKAEGNNKEFYCPSGHGQVFTGGLQSKINEKERIISVRDSTIRRLEGDLRSAKASVTRERKKVKKLEAQVPKKEEKPPKPTLSVKRQVLDYLSKTPKSSAKATATGLGEKKGSVAATLSLLFQDSKVRRVREAGAGTAYLYSLAEESP